MKQQGYSFWLKSGIVLCWLALPSPTQAQVTSDGTLSTNVTTTNQLDFTITDGAPVGGNLFHSFRDFSIPTGGSAVFDNAADVQNIISRVTGGTVSNIDGLIQARGNANLFLINPSGIIFGTNAQLDIGGSFIASTASRLNFADGRVFSATDPQTPPLLSISVPLGLQFGSTAAPIINRAQAQTPSGLFGLVTQPRQTLALIGGDVLLESGFLFAPEGRIELGSVGGNSLVSLIPVDKGWSVGYESVQQFQTIQLSQGSTVDTTDLITFNQPSGDIRLQGGQIQITQESAITAGNFGTTPGGTIVLQASDSLTLSDASRIDSSTFGAGKGGNIEIQTRQLRVLSESFILSTTNPEVNGLGGNITIDAAELVQVDGGGGLSQISTQSFGEGNAGDVRVTTQRLVLRDGGQINSSAQFGAIGNGGDLRINVSESVEASGQGVDGNGLVARSGLLASTLEATGDGGRISLFTQRLSLAEGATISVSAIEGSTGKAGELDIAVSDSIEVQGAGSSIEALSESPQSAGNVTIKTSVLRLLDGGLVSVRSDGTGDAGTVNVTASSILLNNGGGITATTQSGAGGDIQLNAGTLQLNNGLINASTSGSGPGGDITIRTTGDFNIRNGSTVSVSGQGSGNAGNIDIDARAIFLDKGSITATSSSGEGGNINLRVADTVILRNNSLISTQAGTDTSGGGNGGNMNINAKFVVAVPQENSDIIANAYQGNGGNINITTNGIYGLQFREELTPLSDITASSKLGIDGIVDIDILGIDPSQGLVELPENFTDQGRRIVTGCPANEGNSFSITGRGGLPEDPTGFLRGRTVWRDLRTVPQPRGESNSHITNYSISQQIPNRSGQSPVVNITDKRQPTNRNQQLVEATGWIINANGQVELVAHVPNGTPYQSWQQPTECNPPQ